jgi:hypothetical protein
MRLKMIGLAGVSLLLLAGCNGKSPKVQADNACVQKPVCATPAQPPAATTPPPETYAPVPRPRRAVRYRSARWSSGGGSYSRRTTSYVGSSDYEGGTRDYGQIYSAGDTRYAGTRVQVQSSDSYAQSSQSETTYSSYGGGYAGGSVYVSGGPGGCDPCRAGRVRAAGRDRDGYLTWPSK